jgi:hypothetical protein
MKLDGWGQGSVGVGLSRLGQDLNVGHCCFDGVLREGVLQGGYLMRGSNEQRVFERSGNGKMSEVLSDGYSTR